MPRMLVAAAAAIALTGCAAERPLNPSFSLSITEAQAALREMQSSPCSASRPIVIVGGIADPGIVVAQLSHRLRKILSPDTLIIGVAVGWKPSMDAARDELIDRVEDALPGDDPGWTREVDVVAVSMGGLVARHAAAPRDGGRRLRIARLFTISTPHGGATWAALPSLDSKVCDMRPGSEFLSRLDGAEPGYPIFAYVRLGDSIVGAPHAGPPGCAPWWLANQPFTFAHVDAHKDPRIIAEIARRLRSEPPFSTGPPAPLPQLD